VREPEEIEEREHEIAVARVAAVDVAKASGVVCTRVPREGGGGGRFVTKVWPVDATTNAILELADYLVALQIEKVVLESTSDYVRPFFYLLEAGGLTVELVNAHLVSWAKLCPRTLQSGARARPGRTAKGNPYLKGVLGDAAAAAGKTDTFLGERYRRILKRRGKLKALVATARTILVIVWHLLADRDSRYHDLGAAYHATRTDAHRRARNHVRQLQALGFTVTLTPAA
jgi:transposase